MKSLLLLLLALSVAVALHWTRSGRSSVDGERLRVTAAFAPPAGALLALCVSLGLWARRGPGHSSPTVAWIAKRFGLVALGFAAFWVLAAPPWPAWALYLSALGAAAGAGLWLAHLPSRL